MPRKKDLYKSHGEKLISLFAKLLFTGESHSLTDLSRMLDCSKQTVMRNVEAIEKAYGVNIEGTMEGRRKYYRIRRPGRRLPLVNLTEMELHVLQMCRSFARHLLGTGQFEEATRALEKSRALLPAEKAISSRHFASFTPGSIDYTPHQQAIRTLLEAMEEKRICRLTYKSITAKKAKTFYVKPLKIFSHHDTIYLHARLARKPGRPYKEPEFDPLLAIHRIQKVDLDERPFKFPENYDFEKIFNRNFGIIKEDAFEVEVELFGFAARFATERIWSPDQKVGKLGDGRIKLTFTASSKPELIAWVLSFGHEAKLIRPDWLVDKVKGQVARMKENYGF